MTRVWVAVSLVGSPVAMTALCLLTVAVLLTQRRRIMAVGAIVAQGGGGVINEVLKQTIQRPRPPGAQTYLYGNSWRQGGGFWALRMPIPLRTDENHLCAASERPQRVPVRRWPSGAAAPHCRCVVPVIAHAANPLAR